MNEKPKFLETPKGLDIAIVIIAIILLIFFYKYNYLSINSLLGEGLKNSTTVIISSINTIKQGRYNSSIDKLGTGGILAELPDVKVVGMLKEPDGDVHISVVSAQSNSTLETEFTPVSSYYYNETLSDINVNDSVTMIGVPYCDPDHIHDAWHGYSCWELHPIIFIAPNSIQVQSNITFVPEPSLSP